MSITVQLPQREAQRLLEEWQNRAVQLEGELSELQRAIDSVEAQLSGKLPQLELSVTPPASTGKKNKKGENLRIIKTYLGSVNGKGATSAEISEATKIGKSSVYAVLTMQKDTFAKGPDGLWHLKQQ